MCLQRRDFGGRLGRWPVRLIGIPRQIGALGYLEGLDIRIGDDFRDEVLATPMTVESKSISVTNVQARSAGQMRLGDCGQCASRVHGAAPSQPGLANVIGASEYRKCALPGSSSRGPFAMAAGSSPDRPSAPEDGAGEVPSASTRISRPKPAELVSPPQPSHTAATPERGLVVCQHRIEARRAGLRTSRLPGEKWHQLLLSFPFARHMQLIF